jgi:ubiquinone/menaquinone biosynthesis C-methylase UbiE
MAAAYDTYDYPSYWIGREYEHEAEIIAVNSFLRLIPKINCVLDVGAGYGRLIPTFLYRAKKIIVSDPSVKLLKIARKKFTGKNVRFIQSSLENLPNKIRRNSADLIITVRVLHHIKDLNKALSITQRLLNI